MDPFLSLEKEFSNTDNLSSEEMLFYLFWDKGIGYDKVVSYPLPYLFGILRAHDKVMKEQEKAMKK